MPGEQKRLGSFAPSERREHLKRYLMTCVQDHVLSLADLSSAPGKVMQTITTDIKAVVLEVGRSAAGGFLKMAGGALAGMAEDVVAGRRTK